MTNGIDPKQARPTSADYEGMQRLNIVVSSPTFLPIVGGAELGIHEIYRRIALHHDVTIVTPHLRHNMIRNYGAEDYSSAGYRVQRLTPWIERVRPRILGRALKRTSLLYVVQLWLLHRQRKIDVINFHYIVPQGAALIIMRTVSKIPTIISLVGRSDVVQLLDPFRRRYAGLVLSKADAVLPISEFYLRDGAMPAKARVVPYGVDVSEFAPNRVSKELRSRLGINDQDVMLLCVQRLSPVKRVDMLVRALKQIIVRHPETVLVVVGQGSEEEALVALVHELQLEQNVRMCGYVDSIELPHYFASADLFVFYSMMETFGIVFAQAMASGLPIVAADTSCVSDVVRPDNGSVVKDGDVIAFSEAVVDLIADPARRSAIGVNNRSRAEREFDWDRIAGTYEELLRDAARGHC